MGNETKKTSRILALDLMRGYFLISILLNHLYLFPNGLDWLTVRGNLYVSAAEGFFFISGLVLGIVRGRKLISQPFKQVARLLVKRGLVLYIASITLTLLFTFIGWQFTDNPGLKSGIMASGSDLGSVIWKTVSLQYVYGWADYLRLYAIFMLVSPLFMWLLRRDQGYLALLISFCVWLVAQAMTIGQSDPVAWRSVSWQIIFFVGMFIGFYHTKLSAWWNSLAKTKRRAISQTVISLALVTLLANVVLVVLGTTYPMFSGNPWHEILGQVQGSLYGDFFTKSTMQWSRIVLFLLWFTASFLIVRHFEKPLTKWFGWLVLPYGQNSLYSYIISAFVVFFVHLYITKDNFLVNFAVSAGAIAVVWVCIKTKFLMKIIPR
jgi:hypothetical protein